MKTLTLEEIRSAVQCSTGVSPMFPDVSSSSSSSSLQQQLEQKQQQDTGKMPVLQVTGVNTDSRTVKPGELFVAIKGEKHDAHKFLGEVFRAGAAGAIVQRDAPIAPSVAEQFGSRMIVVENTITALGRLAAHHRSLVKAKVIAVTGSNGKTTTKRMVQHILSRHFKGTCSPKSFNNNIGVPLTLLGVSEGDDYVICEVGSNAPGEIAELSAIAKPDVAVITSVGETHLEKLGSVDLVAVEKASMLSHLRPGGRAIVWADSPSLNKALEKFGFHVIRFGQSAGAELRMTEFVGRPTCVDFVVNGKVKVHLPQPGMHNASNALAAIGAAMGMGLTMEQAAAELRDFAGVEMRLESIQIGPVRVINDAYNANPSSMLAAADVLACQEGERRVMVVGDMYELGEDWQGLHERTGADIARGMGTKTQPGAAVPQQHGIDLLIGVGPRGRYIASGAGASGLASQAFDTVEAAAEGLPALLRPGDVVLIKGSRGMAMERLIPPLRKVLSP